MRILVFEGGTIKEWMMGEASEWLVANEAELRSSAPEGTEYLGVYWTKDSSAAPRPSVR